MRIDVVIPAYQAAAYIGECVRAAVAAGLPPEAIFVVDDGSNDGTAAAARAAGAVCLATGGNRGAAAARNRGAAAGRGDVVLFVDADVVVAPDTRRVLEALFAGSPDIAAAFGAYDAGPRAPGMVSRFRNLLHRHVHLQRDVAIEGMAWRLLREANIA